MGRPVFHIRHYTVDDHGNVTRVFSIGREWTGKRQVEMALAQWNCWCMYMNGGPNGLPKPMLFHTQRETPRESFLFSLYGFGMRAPVFVRLLMMPLTLVFTVMRIVANATCRDPVWRWRNRENFRGGARRPLRGTALRDACRMGGYRAGPAARRVPERSQNACGRLDGRTRRQNSRGSLARESWRRQAYSAARSLEKVRAQRLRPERHALRVAQPVSYTHL